jgi:hypothetical protein
MVLHICDKSQAVIICELILGLVDAHGETGVGKAHSLTILGVSTAHVHRVRSIGTLRV